MDTMKREEAAFSEAPSMIEQADSRLSEEQKSPSRVQEEVYPSRPALYLSHCRNHAAVNKGLKHLSIAIRRAIAQNNDSAEVSLTCLYIFMLGAWAETKLLTIIHEKKGFTSKERDKLLREREFERWKETVRLAYAKYSEKQEAYFRKKRIKPYFLVINSIDVDKIITMLSQEFEPLIQLRNRMAHGQWADLLTSKRDKPSQDLISIFKQENFFRLQAKKKILFHLSDIIHNLVVFHPDFKAIFEHHNQCIVNYRRILETQDHSNNYRASLQNKYIRGRKAMLSKKLSENSNVSHT
jgi:hypothetical protein